MNTFFYAIGETIQAESVLSWLTSLRLPLPVQVLPSGSTLHSPEATGMRNGDLLIVYVRNRKELEIFNNSRGEYSNYKLYLIFQKDDPQLIKAGLLLNPIHYSSVEKQYMHAEKTIRKILSQ